MKIRAKKEIEIDVGASDTCSRDCAWHKPGSMWSICRLYGGEHLEPCGEKYDYRCPQCLADFGTGDEPITPEKYREMCGDKPEPTLAEWVRRTTGGK